MSEERLNFCPRCGNKLKNTNAKFCGMCGFHLKKEIETQTSKTSEIENQSPHDENNSSQDIYSPTSTQPVIPQKPQYIPRIDGQEQSQISGFPSQNYQSSPYITPYSPQTQKVFLTPDKIPPVKQPVFEKSEIKIISILSIMAYLSHFLRYLLFYNRFPSLLELIIPLPLYFLVVFLITFFHKKNLQNSGVMTKIKADNYDYMLSIALSTFLLSTLSYRNRIDHELTTIPDMVHMPQSSKFGLSYEEVPKMELIGNHILPRSYLKTTIISTVLATFLLYLYFNATEPWLSSTFRLVAAFVGGFALMEIAPTIGRHNKEMASIWRFRTLLIFLFAFFVTSISILGESFLTALSDR